MKRINNYIIEKLKINKDSKSKDSKNADHLNDDDIVIYSEIIEGGKSPDYLNKVFRKFDDEYAGFISYKNKKLSEIKNVKDLNIYEYGSYISDIKTNINNNHDYISVKLVGGHIEFTASTYINGSGYDVFYIYALKENAFNQIRKFYENTNKSSLEFLFDYKNIEKISNKLL